ncbi:hypothetical protein BJI67_16010 (plasmid) [Acidihalobacter aeolianus]|uniref:DUF4276 family protein n=1 Tax=Acidihalobacter aeolianus TaxID=2792603 RepID=A0A1D8KCQ9_9GAMM|nr:DUF4276 family protein [Acidihalobacter aeolianus]AOV18746.1 hypothetical protein BJI67_16010 [Acidihalobacter aeolianus]
MRRIALFVEDYAHKQFLGALLQRLAEDSGVKISLDWRNARRGHGAVVREFRQYLHDLQREGGRQPDLIVASTDANCKGLRQRTKALSDVAQQADLQIVFAVPDPHIERWLLLDSGAFKKVFGRGCKAPDQKCERVRYKKMLIDAIRESGITPSLGGIEYAEDIVKEMDLGQAARNDASLQRLLEEFNAVFREWQQ